jgi:hypothetical protein
MKFISVAVLSLVVAGGAYADCGKDHAAAKKDAKAGHSCPMHAEKAAAKTAEGKHACNHEAKAAATSAEGEHACNHEAKTADAEKACPMKDKTAAETTALDATGKVLCMKCNLGKEKECRKVFQPASDTTALYTVCPMSDMAAIEKLSEHGEATLAVKGKMVKATDGTIIVKIENVEKAKS